MNVISSLSTAHPVRLLDLRLRIDAAAYVVDPAVVADALLRRGGLPVLGLSPGGARSPEAAARRPR